MKRQRILPLLAAVVLMWATPVEAQIIGNKTINAQSTGPCVQSGANPDCAEFDVPNAPSLTIQISNAFVGTLEFEITGDGTTWTAVLLTNLADGVTSTSTAAAGQFYFTNGGTQKIRVRASAFTPGTSARVVAIKGAGVLARGGTAGAGDIEGVTAGAGLTGGGASGSVTVNVIAGAGITVNANDVQVHSDILGGGFWTSGAVGQITGEVSLAGFTGLVLNTAGTPSAYLGTSCTNQFPRSLNGSGAATCATVASTDLAAGLLLSNPVATTSSDAISLAVRRNGAAQVANVMEIQTEGNGFLAGFNALGVLTAPGGVFTSYVGIPEVTAFPASPAAGWTVTVTDDSAVGACDSAAGAARSLCTYNGAAWVSNGDGGAGAATLLNLIGDAGGDGVVDMGTNLMQFTSTRALAGTVWDVLNTEADLVANIVLETKRFNDTADANGFYARYIADADGTPVTQFQFGMTASILGTTGMTVAADGTWTFSGSTVMGTPASINLTNGTALPLTGLANQAADTVLANVTAGSAAPTAVTYATLATEMGIPDSDTLPVVVAITVYDGVTDNRYEYITPGTGVLTSLAIAMTGSGGFAGSTSPAFTTSATTPSTTFALFDATMTTLNAFGAATTSNIFRASGAVINVGGGANSAEFYLMEPSGGGTSKTGFKAPALGATLLWTLPPSTSAGCAWTDTAGDGVMACTVPAGSGNVSKVGTPSNNQGAVWTGDGTLEGTSDWTYDGTNFNIITAKNFQIAGGTVLADAAGTLTLSNVDALDATTAATVGAATKTLTNTTLDAEGTGNVLTLVGQFAFMTGVLQGATASGGLSCKTGLCPTATSMGGTNIPRTWVTFPDSDGEFEQVFEFQLAPDFVGVMDVRGKWRTAATTGDIVLQVQWACSADAETFNDTWSTASTTTETAKGTTLQLNDWAVTGVTITGCAATETVSARVMRQRTHASDSLTGTFDLGPFNVFLRRAQ